MDAVSIDDLHILWILFRFWATQMINVVCDAIYRALILANGWRRESTCQGA